MKVPFLLTVLAISIIPLLNFGTTYGISEVTPINPANIVKDCHPACFDFVPTHANQNGNHQVIDFTHNQDFTVIMADGSCNISGTFNQATNVCSVHSLVLTPNDFKKFQTNVASMYVGNIFSTNTPENVDYCTLAEWSWSHQTPTFQAKYDIYTVIPPTCFTSTPDFSPSISLVVMMIAITSSVIISKRNG